MAAKSQSVRPSQFITTYGPGSILEGPDGPRVVSSLDRSGVFGANPSPSDYAIFDAGLAQLLPEQAQIVRLPTNAEREVPDNEPIYATTTFPSWSLCVEHSILYRYQNQSTRTGCPSCASKSHWVEAWRQSRREAVRFVKACPAGHLDDVPWPQLIPHKTPACAPQTLRWEGGGAALRNVEIRCPDCGASANLGALYARNHRCSGRNPELATSPGSCQRDARISQRGAANLYVSEMVAAVTIPKLDSKLHQVLASSQIKPILLVMQSMSGGNPLTGQTIKQNIQTAASTLRGDLISELNKHDDARVAQAAQDVLSMVMPTTLEGARVNEFTALQRAANNGHPSQASSTPGAPPLFEVIAANVRRAVPCPGGHTLRVTPVSRLRVVMVQTGYRRLDGGPDDLVSTLYTHGQDRYLPGVELHGEGIFIDLTPEDLHAEAATSHFPLEGEDISTWMQQWSTREDPEDHHRHPVFVWWHTFAHRLILALSVDSGYSSAAIRERVYVRVDPDTGVASGGVLLYTAQPGGDGTLGGLIALVPTFGRVLHSALRDVDSCSNDPLCNEERFEADRSNGAACYACSFVSETSCEFRNMFLDRNILRANMP